MTTNWKTPMNIDIYRLMDEELERRARAAAMHDSRQDPNASNPAAGSNGATTSPGSTGAINVTGGWTVGNVQPTVSPSPGSAPGWAASAGFLNSGGPQGTIFANTQANSYAGVHSSAMAMNQLIGMRPNVKLSVGSGIKSNVKFVVVQEDGTCLELDPADTMTPREMIAITQFITVASALMAGGNAKVNWSEMAANLDIERHFIFGEDKDTSYPDDEHIHIFLYDAV